MNFMSPYALKQAFAHVFATLAHKVRVGRYMVGFAARILYRAIRHDNSKLHSPELTIFANAPVGPYDVPYGSQQYFNNLATLSQALVHHYTHNSHHPEHYADGVSGMNLIDLVEMVSDWQAAASLHRGANFQEILSISQQRYGMSDDLSAILANSKSEN
jgi:hypothetical protein